MHGYYILKNKIPVPASLIEWGLWFESADRIVKQEEVDGVKVSTVFLGLDHSFSDISKPLLFETMIFGGEHDEYCERYSTWMKPKLATKRQPDIVNGKTIL